jgi:hypothetical protein
MARYGYNVPKYGYQKIGGGTPQSPYYRTASALRDQNLFSPQQGTDLFQSPLIGTSAAPLQAPRVAQYTAPTAETSPPADGAQAPVAAPKQPAAPTPQPGSTSLLYDYRTDPILQQIQAVSVHSRADADTNALAARKRLAVQYGDADYARNVLHDDLTAEAAKQNPYSTYAQLDHQQPVDANALDESLNKANLFYGGARIRQQGQLADQYGQARAAATQQEQDALSSVEQNRLSQVLAANANDQAAEQDAYMRQLQAAIAGAYAYGPPAATEDTAPDETATATAKAPALVAALTAPTYFDSGGQTFFQSNRGRYGKKPIL